ncbi:hypothetical protein TUM12370_09380 [Salmonella enterica subsp. enterica serovar Choleraesuis]|nr:hypothetical protein TUM12370_09380 [Salmonella enterica subsp. enterica serovar Choleraesuis]
MIVEEIPLSADNQTFSIQLAGTSLRLKVIWRDNAGWLLDLYNPDGSSLLQGIPLVCGVDLLAPYRHLGIGGELRLLCDDPRLSAADKNTLGTNSHLLFIASAKG